ncbi:hypothetical protein BO70DRAFT_1046 [Aspergillus heteromorphus CBS 117.55]|uniref:BZIP domain-containing protein n=1 Tax=Aspergillus heteromorphus CBS 117.55 TaxID=1448321 RepID=A0A317X328_9EURO|nr:uncharacterized protein BO70DRAFT_1046 [Aspergillus heteromorphus CBS 117.55]PWY92032.1 hypothetical protein BO70DRAFT_1046 [Aspergillus heteromorphus CBS 117.55]
MSPTPEPPPIKKRESRAGARKVTSLSAEQLERKRANDREAQRTIRQRTKEHIERLEHQVAELKAKGDRFDDVVRQNAALEHEIRALRHQLAMTGRQGYPGLEGSYSNPSGPMLPSAQFAEPLGVNSASRTPSALSTSSRVSMGTDWPPYSSTRSPSLCDSTETSYGNRVEPYVFENQLQTPNAIPVAPPPVAYNASVVAQHQPHDPAFQSYPQGYHAGASSRGPGEELSQNPQQPVPCMSNQRSMSVPPVPPERGPGGYPVVHAPQQYHQHPLPPQARNDYSYGWAPHQS